MLYFCLFFLWFQNSVASMSSSRNKPVTRSDSNPNTAITPTRLSKIPGNNSMSQDVRSFLSSFKEDITLSFKREFSAVFEKLTSLENKVELFQNQLTVVKEEQERQAAEIETLKTKFDGMDSSSLCADITEEVSQRYRRRRNVIIRGLPESVGSVEERVVADGEVVQSILKELEILDRSVTEVKRIGRPSSNGSRILKVAMSSESTRQDCLRRARSLKGSSFGHVFIQPDLTPSQQKADREKRRRLKSVRDMGQDAVLYRGEIRLRDNLGFRQ